MGKAEEEDAWDPRVMGYAARLATEEVGARTECMRGMRCHAAMGGAVNGKAIDARKEKSWGMQEKEVRQQNMASRWTCRNGIVSVHGNVRRS